MSRNMVALGINVEKDTSMDSFRSPKGTELMILVVLENHKFNRLNFYRITNIKHASEEFAGTSNRVGMTDGSLQ